MELLGQGAHGKVYTLEDPSMCVKISNKKSTCRQWTDEYEKIKEIEESLMDIPIYHKLERVRLLVPLDHETSETICNMFLPRIYRPTHDGETMTVQSQLGKRSDSYIHKGRGEFIGLEQILDYMDEKIVNQVCYELGVLMSLIHYHARNDALDIEVFMGREYRNKKVRFYIGDFDMSSRIHAYDTNTVTRMLHSLEDVPYFPRPEVNMEMYHIFKHGYYSVVPLELVPIAERIFEEYE